MLLALALAAAATAGACTLPWLPIAKSQHELPCTVPGSRAAFVAGSVSDTSRFVRSMAAEDRPKLRRIDYRRFAVVAVFRCFREGGHSFELESIVRSNQVLKVTLRIHELPPGTGATQGVEGHYEIVAVRKNRLGAPLPRRVALVERTVEADAPN